jgi:hypothetical protein
MIASARHGLIVRHHGSRASPPSRPNRPPAPGDASAPRLGRPEPSRGKRRRPHAVVAQCGPRCRHHPGQETARNARLAATAVRFQPRQRAQYHAPNVVSTRWGAAMTRTGKAIDPQQPLVSDVPRAARLLGCEPDRLEDAVAAAGLAPWGEAASGVPVWRWPELCEAARAAGLAVPDRLGHAWRRRPTVIPTKAKT